MSSKFWIVLGLLIGSFNLSGCATAIVAGAGAAAVVVADKIAENNGDDGLF